MGSNFGKISSNFNLSNIKSYNNVTSRSINKKNIIKNAYANTNVLVTDAGNSNYQYEINSQEIEQYLLDSAENDARIDTSNNFDNYTDYQNVMVANFSFFELLYPDDIDSLAGKSIRELLLESYDGDIEKYTLEDFLNFSLDEDAILSLWSQEAKDRYRTLYLGKLLLDGFGDLKVVEVIRGEDGFDALVLMDGEGNYMIHYPCTDIYETEDYLHDMAPILEEINLGAGLIESTTNANAIFESQKRQALEVLSKYLNDENVTKINISGYSLGGALAEYAYFENYGKNQKLNDIVLYNPASYQVKTDMDLVKDAYEKGNLKLYAAEGDVASTVYYGENFDEYTKPVYIGYHDIIANSKSRGLTENNVLDVLGTNMVSIYIKSYTDICQKLINEKAFGSDNQANAIYDVLQTFLDLFSDEGTKNLPIKDTFARIDAWCNEHEDMVNLISIMISRISGQNVDLNYAASILDEVQYLAIILTGLHIPYSAEMNKDISFDEYGMVKTQIDDYEVTYPEYAEICEEVFGYNIADDLKDHIYNIQSVDSDDLFEYYFADEYNLLSKLPLTDGMIESTITARVIAEFLGNAVVSQTKSIFTNVLSSPFVPFLDNISTSVIGVGINEVAVETQSLIYTVSDTIYEGLDNLSQSITGLSINEVKVEIEDIIFDIASFFGIN